MIIGLDALTLDLVRPWAKESRLPNLARFLNCGAFGTLRSTLPVVSPAAWSTFATGTNPAKHGITDFRLLLSDSYVPRFASAAYRRGETFWEVAGQHAIRGGVVNVPVTYPPREYNGFIVSGMLSPAIDRNMVSPPEIFDELMGFAPDYSVHVGPASRRGRDARAVFLERAMSMTDAQLQGALGLYRKHRPQLFCLVLVGADRICHFYWRYLDALRSGRAKTDFEYHLGGAILRMYEKLDEAVGALVSEGGDETDFLILSDHGATAQYRGVNLRKLFAREGLLVETRPNLGERAAKWAHDRFTKAAPRRLQGKIVAAFPNLARRASSAALFSGVDFTRTKAYPTGYSMSVFVNLKGRQPHGIVEPGAEYEAVRDEIISILSELKDPQTGQHLASKVCRREEVWSGPRLSTLPDVVMEPGEEIFETPLPCNVESDDVFYTVSESRPGRMFRSGGHHPDGLLLGMGPHIKNTQIRGANIVDVPATVLGLLGCPVPENFDGKVLTEMLTDDVQTPAMATSSVSGADGGPDDVFTGADHAAIEKRLKALGYL
jgi:predicted AlkP superfamily phosphohydrolase/phosphomutase